MNNFKYKSIFASKIKSLPLDKDPSLALASFEELKAFLPDITEDDIDLLPISCSTTVANMVNLNDDGLDTETALKIYRKFEKRLIDENHKRKNILGVILKAGLSDYNTEKLLTEKDVIGTKEPFNITVGGVLWRVINPDLMTRIEENSNPESRFFNSLFSSWEIGVQDFTIIGIEGDSRYTKDAKFVITDAEEIEKVKENLTAFGGSGSYNGCKIYRMIGENSIPLGLGIVTSPAADVAPLLSADMPVVISVTNDSEGEHKESLAAEKIIKNNCSTLEKTVVIESRNMKIKSLQDINESNWKEITASATVDFINDEIRKANEQYKIDLTAKETEVAAIKAENNQVKTDLQKANDTLAQVQTTLASIQKDNAEKAKLQTFSQRMASFDDNYVLSKEDREVISAAIKELDDNSFTSYEKTLSVLMKEKNKAFKQAQATTIVVASKTPAEVIDAAVDTAKVDKGTTAIVTAPADQLTMKEKYSKAFAEDQWLISK